VELLYRRHWARLDGLGALVLTPTRELAIQIFETLVQVGGLASAVASAVGSVRKGV
jgi:ATP-dependent RNA helicase DDX10/DBP4